VSIYAYGMSVWSTIHRIAGPLPRGDGYAEVAEFWRVPAGEATNGAILLSAWGYQVRLEGALLGTATRGPLTAELGRWGIHMDGMAYDPTFEGFLDLVFSNGEGRYIYGSFERHRRRTEKCWRPPDEQAISAASLALVDPYFEDDSEQAGRLCARHGTPYVTLDCRHDSGLHSAASATVLSNQYRAREYPGLDDATLLSLYADAAPGLTVFTSGTRPVQFARAARARATSSVPAVNARLSIGAGDTFRAGIAYGLLQGWSDEHSVRFAIQAAAAVCVGGPVACAPPATRGWPHGSRALRRPPPIR
jgi:sugar/nucleoside kinase (ribokinase family)